MNDLFFYTSTYLLNIERNPGVIYKTKNKPQAKSELNHTKPWTTRELKKNQ